MFTPAPNNDGGTSNDALNAGGAGSSNDQADAAGKGSETPNNDGGQGTVDRPSWLDNAPNSHKNNEAFYGYESPGSLMDAHMELLGQKDRVTVPGENATAEEKAAYNKAVGIPEKPEDYGFTKPADLPEGVGWDQEAADSFAKFCHEKGMTVDQAQSSLSYYNEQISKLLESTDKELEKAVEGNEKILKDRLKNDYEPFMKSADQVLKALVSEDTLKAIQAESIDTLILNSPAFAMVLHDLKTKVLGDRPLSGGDGGGDKGPKTDPSTRLPVFDYPSMVEK
jgi:hypothetical protein